MATAFHESNIDWAFDDSCLVIQYDDSSWYRQHFQGCAESAAVDFIAVAGTTGWLVEVKDFTTEAPVPSKDLVAIVTKKARDTLAGVFAGAKNANAPQEKDIFVSFLQVTSLRVAFHCERPTNRSKLFKNLPDPADLQQKLRKSLRAIDTKVVLLDCTSNLPKVPWTATWNPNGARR